MSRRPARRRAGPLEVAPALEVATDLRPSHHLDAADREIASSSEGVGEDDLRRRPMGLLSTLELEQILDLVATIESGGNPNHPAFAE